jgi:CRISPR-associated protein Csd1
MLSWNLAFRLHGDCNPNGEPRLLHERPTAAAHIEHLRGNDPSLETGFCLVTGEKLPMARLHPKIKGVSSQEVPLVSFDDAAFKSYGRERGANAPTSERAAFQYGAALNRLLDRSKENRLRRKIADATVVFWADASVAGEHAAQAAEDVFGFLLDPPDDASEAAKLRDALGKLIDGRPVEDLDLGLVEGTHFHVLGLAPNAGRIAVRYWLEDSFEMFAKRLAEHYRDLTIEPSPWRSKSPSIRRLLAKTTALQEKFDNIPPLLAGEVMRAILAGTPYPRTLLSAAITRLRAGDDPWAGWHAAVIKAFINRSGEEAAPMALDPNNPSCAYQLGRLFAVIESAQYAALGRVNAPISTRYYGSASATPALVFGPLLRGLRHHVADALKRRRGGWIDARVGEIMAKLPPQLPHTLRLEDQGRFAIGYYHERAFRGVNQDESGTGETNPDGEEVNK